MKSIRIISTVVFFVAVAIFVFQFGTASAQKTKGKTRAAATKYLMRGIVRPSCAGIGGLLKDGGPKDDKTWDAIACHASCLNEMSYALMDDGRCPDGVWAKAAKTTLRECSASVLEAANKKDLEKTQAAFTALTKSCGACHKAHKGK